MSKCSSRETATCTCLVHSLWLKINLSTSLQTSVFNVWPLIIKCRSIVSKLIFALWNHWLINPSYVSCKIEHFRTLYQHWVLFLVYCSTNVSVAFAFVDSVKLVSMAIAWEATSIFCLWTSVPISLHYFQLSVVTNRIWTVWNRTALISPVLDSKQLYSKHYPTYLEQGKNSSTVKVIYF